MKKKAFCVVRDQPHYRFDAFMAGLREVGFDVVASNPRNFNAGEVLVCWNRYGYNDQLARHMESAGGIVIVAENGYLGQDAEGRQLYAMARRGHNGSGAWFVGDDSRWMALGVELKPWREDGKHILVCGQRGIGSPTMASPANWHEDVAARLKKITSRPVRIRRHPEDRAFAGPKVDLADDLKDAYAVVVWSSSSGVKALVEGIPVFYEAPHWICEASALPGIGSIDKPMMSDVARSAAMSRMAWAQWRVDEIAAGEPFKRLLA